MPALDQVSYALALCEQLVPKGRFYFGGRGTIECSKSNEARLRRIAKRQAISSTLMLPSKGALRVAGVEVRVRPRAARSR